MHLNCHGELTWLAWIIGSGSLIIGYLIARVRCWWQHVRNRCPSCGIGRVTVSNVRMRWNYGDTRNPDAQVQISAVLPVNTCQECGFEYEDHRAERIRGAATAEYLRRHKD